VRNEEILRRVKEYRNILYTIQKMASWIGYILRKNCLLQDVSEQEVDGRIEGTKIRRKRRKSLLADVKGKRGYWKLKIEALDCTVWSSGFE